jgi:hypothetical protein
LKAYVEISHPNFEQLTLNIQKQFYKKASEACAAYIFLEGAESHKFGSLHRELQHQFGLDNDQYPKTLEAAKDALSSRNWDAGWKDKKQKTKQNDIVPETKTQAPETSIPQAITYAQLENTLLLLLVTVVTVTVQETHKERTHLKALIVCLFASQFKTSSTHN